MNGVVAIVGLGVDAVEAQGGEEMISDGGQGLGGDAAALVPWRERHSELVGGAPRAAQRLAALSRALWAVLSFCQIRASASMSSSSSGSIRYSRMAFSSVRATFRL